MYVAGVMLLLRLAVLSLWSGEQRKGPGGLMPTRGLYESGEEDVNEGNVSAYCCLGRCLSLPLSPGMRQFAEGGGS